MLKQLLLLLGLWPLLTALPDNLIANGEADIVNGRGELAAWSLVVERGEAVLAPLQVAPVEGEERYAARLQLGETGAVFEVRTGLPQLAPLPRPIRYRFSARVNLESGAPPLSCRFLVTVGKQQIEVPVKAERGWQTVSQAVEVPAHRTVRRVAFAGAADGPAELLIDDVRLLPPAVPIAGPPDPLAGPLQLQPGEPLVIRKIMPTDVRLVRGLVHAPLDGRTDTRHAKGGVSEWMGLYGTPAVNYRFFNGNNGLHVHLPEPIDAFQIWGGWHGRAYADYGHLETPAITAPYLADIRPEGAFYSRRFESPLAAETLSFFYHDTHRRPLAELSLLQVQPGTTLTTPESIAYRATEVEEKEGRVEITLSAHDEATEQTADSTLPTAGAWRLLTPAQPSDRGIAGVTLSFRLPVDGPTPLLELRVRDLLDERRQVMRVAIMPNGTGRYHVSLDVPDMVPLPTEPVAGWRMAGPWAPEPRLQVELVADQPVALADLQVTVHQVPRQDALAEAVAWRLFLLRGLFSSMSEPRPWMHLKDGVPVRQQIAESGAIRRYRESLTEVLETVEIAHQLAPEQPLIGNYHEWLYQNMDRRKPQPPPQVAPVPGAPEWAVLVRQGYLDLEAIAQWWLDNRQVANGEFGGYAGDDTDLFQTWQCLPMIESEPLGHRLREAAADLSDLVSEQLLQDGLNIRTLDSLHAYEEGINQLALCAWWFYGDPVHYERLMVSARSILQLMVETPDGRLHFPANDLGIDSLRQPPSELGTTVGNGNWAPVRFLLHPVYTAAWYNRHPRLLERFEQWGRSWAGYQAPGRWVGQVEIASGRPTVVSEQPTPQAIGPVKEWLALYQLTGDDEWRRPFEMLLESEGYWGTSVQYGRMEHALVAWDEPYRQILAERVKGGYAGFFLHQDREMLMQDLRDSAAWFGRFRHMDTAAEQKTDRILTYRATVPLAAYLGDAPNRNRWLMFNAVSYEGLQGEDFAALVWQAGPDRLKVALYNFRDQELRGGMRVWRLDHGRYRVITGPDLDDDGQRDRTATTHAQILHRHATIDLALPPGEVTIVEVEQLEQRPAITTRPDLALSPLSTRLTPDGALVTVHNIGSVDARSTRLELHREGQVVARLDVPALKAPLELVPRSITLRFPEAKQGDSLYLDPDDKLAEISESNNALVLEAVR